MAGPVRTGWDTVFEEVLRSVLPGLPPGEALQPDDDLRALGLDSQALVEVLVRLETAYEALLPDEALDFRSFATPQGLWETVAPIARAAAGSAS
jgi:acyl carrier protein